jgi:hypothetical protein
MVFLVRRGFFMPENETLDIRNSPRWIPVIRSIRDAAPSDDVERCIREALAKSWDAIRKQFRKTGFTLQQVLAASAEGDTAFLDKAYRDSKYHRFVRLIGQCRCFMDGPLEILERTINSQLRIVKDQVCDFLVSRGVCCSFAEADARVATPFQNIAPIAAAYARRLVEAPVRAATLLTEPQTSDVPAESILHHSLINPAALPIGIGR